MRRPSCSAKVLIRATRAIASECSSAARLRLTREAVCSATCRLCGSASNARNACSHDKVLPSSNSPSRKNVRQKRLSSTFWADKLARPDLGMAVRTQKIAELSEIAEISRISRISIGNKHIAHAPHRLDVARVGGILFDQLAQARHLHIQTAVERLKLAPTRQQGQLFARQRLARVAHQRLEHGKFAGGQR